MCVCVCNVCKYWMCTPRMNLAQQYPVPSWMLRRLQTNMKGHLLDLEHATPLDKVSSMHDLVSSPDPHDVTTIAVNSLLQKPRFLSLSAYKHKTFRLVGYIMITIALI